MGGTVDPLLTSLSSLQLFAGAPKIGQGLDLRAVSQTLLGSEVDHFFVREGLIVTKLVAASDFHGLAKTLGLRRSKVELFATTRECRALSGQLAKCRLCLLSLGTGHVVDLASRDHPGRQLGLGPCDLVGNRALRTRHWTLTIECPARQRLRVYPI